MKEAWVNDEGLVKLLELDPGWSLMIGDLNWPRI